MGLLYNRVPPPHPPPGIACHTRHPQRAGADVWRGPAPCAWIRARAQARIRFETMEIVWEGSMCVGVATQQGAASISSPSRDPDATGHHHVAEPSNCLSCACRSTHDCPHEWSARFPRSVAQVSVMATRCVMPRSSLLCRNAVTDRFLLVRAGHVVLTVSRGASRHRTRSGLPGVHDMKLERSRTLRNCALVLLSHMVQLWIGAISNDPAGIPISTAHTQVSRSLL